VDVSGEATERRLASNIKAARERKDLSQREVADLMKSRGFPWHQQTVGRVESAVQPIRAVELKEIADILGASMDALMRPAELEMAAADIMVTARKVREVRREIDGLQRRYDMDAAYLRQLLERARANGTAERLRGEIRAGMSALGERHSPPADDQ
jgi:transcriptional regulator with XRE-family HTH domain